MPKKNNPPRFEEVAEEAETVEGLTAEPEPQPVAPTLTREAIAEKYGQHRRRTAYLLARLQGVTDAATAGAVCDEFASKAFPRDVMLAELMQLID